MSYHFLLLLFTHTDNLNILLYERAFCVIFPCSLHTIDYTDVYKFVSGFV